VQCQYPYADTRQRDAPTDRSPDDRSLADHRNRPHDPMTTPDDTTTPETTRATDQRTTDAIPLPIAGRAPTAEAAGAPFDPDLRPTRRPRTDGGSR